MTRREFAGLILAAVLVVTVALVSFYTVRLAHERDRARRGEAKAEQVAAFLTDMFALADPDQSRGADITAREILTRGAERVNASLADQPDVSVWTTPDSYRAARFGMDWLTHLLGRHGHDHWVVTADPDLVDVSANRQMILVTVCDDGNPIDEEVENQLFSRPISSGQGMGIGLYQSAIMARTFNYELDLSSNQPGKICFSLYQHLVE